MLHMQEIQEPLQETQLLRENPVEVPDAQQTERPLQHTRSKKEWLDSTQQDRGDAQASLDTYLLQVPQAKGDQRKQ
jgi:hypothetical protein